ncbi:MAG: GtrA family protein [Clostridia bacterium]|nr:GtrA family protein [Clostridia bacterium]
MNKEFIKETFRYLIVGVITTVIAISLLWLFYNTLGLEENVSNVISNIITIIIAYVLNRVFVFKSKDTDILKESLKFISSRVIVAIIDVILFFILSVLITSDFTVLSIEINHVLLIKIIVNIVVIILNYIFSKLFVFKNAKKA